MAQSIHHDGFIIPSRWIHLCTVLFRASDAYDSGYMTKKELEARNEVKWETYTKKIQIEARVLGDLSMNHIIPVATSYQSSLLKNVERMTAAFPAEKAAALNARNL